MKHRLFKRYFLGMATIVVLSLGIMMLLLFVTYNNHLSSEKCDELKNVCVTVSRMMTDFEGDTDEKTVLQQGNSEISNIRYFIDCDIYITDNSGKIVVCCCDEWYENDTCEHIGSTIEAEELKLISSGKERFGTASFYAKPRYISANPINYNGEDIGYVFASASSESVKPLVIKSPFAIAFAASDISFRGLFMR